MKQKLLKYLIVILTFLGVSCYPLHTNAEQALEQMSSDKLIEEADALLKNDNPLTKRALECLSTVSKRYYEAPQDKEGRRWGVEAMRRLGNIYMTYAFNYSAAYKNLTLALQIAKEDEIIDQQPYIYLSLSNLYHVNTTAKNQEYLQPLTIEALNKALDTSISSKNDEVISMVILNMLLTTFYDKDSRGAYQDAFNKFKSYKYNQTNDDERMTRLLLSGMEAYWNGDINKAVETITRAKKFVSKCTFSYRTEYSIDLILIHIFNLIGEYHRAINITKSDLEFAHKNGHSDYELTLLAQLSNIYDVINLPDSANYYYSQFLFLNRKFEDEAGFHSVETLNFLTEIEKINQEVAELSLQKHHQRQLLIVLSSGLAVVIILLVSVLYIHRRLRNHHKQLFNQYEETSKREKRYEATRREMEKYNSTLQQTIKHLQANNILSPEVEEPDVPNEETDKELLLLYNNIISFIENSDEIYMPGYTLSMLSKSVKAQTRDVSRAINTLHNCNFNQLLNEYRIKRACNMMRSPENDSFTIESIAERVGIKSRTTFAALFKKATGLTPSNYWDIARKQRKQGTI